MRIVIDLQGVQTESRFRGIGRYSLSLAKAIVRNAGEHEIWLTLNGAFPESVLTLRDEFRNLIPQEHIRVFQVPLPVAEHDPENSNRARVAELIREYFLEQLNPDVVLVTSLFEGYIDDAVTSVGRFAKSYKTAVILYDLIPYMDEERYLPSSVQKSYYHKKIDSLQNADMLFAISEASKQECESELRIPNEKVINISTAVDETFKPKKLSRDEKQALFAKYGIIRKMVMYAPGGFDVRKNFENLIVAYSKLPQYLRDLHQLVIISKIYDDYRLNLENIAKKAGLKKDELIITGYVIDEELIVFYSTCTLFVFPSLHEGFGLPALEAMACGAAVIGSNTTSVPEVIGYEKALFDPKSADAIAKKMQEVLEDEALLQELREHSLHQCKKFSWDKSAKVLIKTLEHIDKSNSYIHISQNLLIQKISQQLIDYDSSDDDRLIENISNIIYLNRLESQIKTIWIDITQIRIQDFATGIQRVVKAVLDQIFRIDNMDYVIKLIYLEHGSQQTKNYGWVYRYATDYQNSLLNQQIIEDSYFVEPKSGDIFLGLDLISYVVEAEKDKLYTEWKERGVAINFVVYDILPILHPEWWPQEGGNIHTKWLETILKVSDKLICISNAVANDIKTLVKKRHMEYSNSLEYHYFHLGADIDNSNPSKGLPEDASEILDKLKATKIFLMVGTLEPRKGHKQTLEAFEKLWSGGEDISLVMVGKEGWMMEDFTAKIKNHPELNKRLFWLEGISDEYLEKVYESSTCLIAASEGEGFGLPLIEAAQHKKPIIARDIPVFREVAEEFAYYFDNSNDPQVLQKTIKEWLELYKNDQHPKSDAMPWLTWEESAKQLIEKILWSLND